MSGNLECVSTMDDINLLKKVLQKKMNFKNFAMSPDPKNPKKLLKANLWNRTIDGAEMVIKQNDLQGGMYSDWAIVRGPNNTLKINFDPHGMEYNPTYKQFVDERKPRNEEQRKIEGDKFIKWIEQSYYQNEFKEDFAKIGVHVDENAFAADGSQIIPMTEEQIDAIPDDVQITYV